jgi:glycosyltransferase involved in cell wall biosynthesis
VKILHLTYSYTPKDIIPEDIYKVSSENSVFQFWKFLQTHPYNILHIHTVNNETFGMYALIARVQGLRVIITQHNPTVFSYAYIIKRLAMRWCISHTVCTSRYDMYMVEKYHLAKKSKRSLVYEGVDSEDIQHVLDKESARSFIYKKIGVSFTKNIRMVGIIVDEDAYSGVEHVIDMIYLADLYKNLTNTIFIILTKHGISKDVMAHIHDVHVEGICFCIEYVHNPNQYIKAFDIYISPRVRSGDLYHIIQAMHAQVSCISTKVGDTLELDTYVSAPLVPPASAKYLTEALMYVIAKNKEISSRIGVKAHVFPKKFTVDVEKKLTQEIYNKVKKKI